MKGDDSGKEVAVLGCDRGGIAELVRRRWER